MTVLRQYDVEAGAPATPSTSAAFQANVPPCINPLRKTGIASGSMCAVYGGWTGSITESVMPLYSWKITG